MPKKSPNAGRAQPAKTKKRANKGRRNGKSGPAMTQHVHAACSILDPFCVHAKAAKRPDGLGGQTLTSSIHGQVSVTTDANGSFLLAVVPGYGIYGTGKATIAAGVATLPANWTALPGSGFVDGNSSDIRIVSMGAIFRSTAAMTNCQGLLHTYVLPHVQTGQALVQMNQNNPEDTLNILTSGYECSMISKPKGTDAHAFKPKSAITNTMSDFAWNTLVFEVNGGAISQTIGSIEIIVNVEFSINNAGLTAVGLGGVTQAPRPANPIALQTQSKVQTSIPSIIQGGKEIVAKRIEGAASSALNGFLDSAMDFGLGLLTML